MITTEMEWKTWALEAEGDLEDMFALTNEISRSPTVTFSQSEAAKAAKRALRTALDGRSDVALAVAKLRFKKLVAALD